jgi:GT2 family glycosyltransferase
MATQPTQVDGISGACMLVSRAAYERVVNETGEFFDGHFIAYREDAELGVRAALVGVESWVVPSAAALHVRGLRGTQRGISVHVDRLGVRNRFLIKIKLGRYRPGRPLAAAARDLLVVLGVLVKEWSSIPGLVDAWKLRHVMREKHRRLEEVVHSRSDVF